MKAGTQEKILRFESSVAHAPVGASRVALPPILESLFSIETRSATASLAASRAALPPISDNPYSRFLRS